MTSVLFKSYYSRVSFWYNGLCRITACWRVFEQTHVTYSEEERLKIDEVNRLLDRAEKIFSEVWASRIGKATTDEIRLRRR